MRYAVFFNSRGAVFEQIKEYYDDVVFMRHNGMNVVWFDHHLSSHEMGAVFDDMNDANFFFNSIEHGGVNAKKDFC